jgi:signal transduction histidine kinase
MRELDAGSPGRGQAGAIVAAGAASVAFASWMIVVGWRAVEYPVLVRVVDYAPGLCFVAAGLIAWWRWPGNMVGKLAVAAGTVWYAGLLQHLGNPVLFVVGYLLAYLPAVVVLHTVLIYPDGTLQGRIERWGLAAVYLIHLILHGLRYLDEGDTRVIGMPESNTAWADVISGYSLVPTALVVVWFTRRWRAASPPMRRMHAPVWLSVLTMTGLFGAAELSSLLELPIAVQLVFVLGHGLGLIWLPFAFLSGLLRVRLARQRIADFVVALEDSPDPARLRDLLSDTLGDPSLVLGFRAEPSGGYVDAVGRPVVIPETGHRAVTYVEGPEDRLAVLVHDPALTRQQALVSATVAAARLTLDNARLQAVSRTRGAEAALSERRALERDLHDGLQPRLLRLSWLAEQTGATVSTSDAARPLLRQLAREAKETYATLRDLAHGIHPAILTERGLAAAVEEHATRSTVPMLVDLPARRWPPVVEATAFFVILEAATNVAKHAGADRITVVGRERAGRLRIEISDNGAGGADGADDRHGSGLRGMRERSAAAGGTLEVFSPAGQGTRVVLDLPCA